MSGSGATIDVFLQQGEGYILQSVVRSGKVRAGDYFSCAGKFGGVIEGAITLYWWCHVH